jgi:hypothetical protein
LRQRISNIYRRREREVPEGPEGFKFPRDEKWVKGERERGRMTWANVGSVIKNSYDLDSVGA